jgi:DUF4097 and DUF4098 domain-containing protein YvlB
MESRLTLLNSYWTIVIQKHTKETQKSKDFFEKNTFDIKLNQIHIVFFRSTSMLLILMTTVPCF